MGRIARVGLLSVCLSLLCPLVRAGEETKPRAFGDEAPRAVMTLVDASGQPVSDEIDAGRMIVITTEMSSHDSVDGSLRWRIEGTSQVHIYPDKSAAVITSELTGGLIRVQLIAAKGGRSDDQVIQIKVGHGPKPPPDVKPDPKPDVKPVDPAPGPVSNLRILIVYETEDLLTREQLNILNSTALLKLLNDKCGKDAQGRAGWRRWDKSTIDRTGLANEAPAWKSLWDGVSPKLTALPSVVLQHDGGTSIVPLPATEAEAVELLKRIEVKR